jgi:signal transduction histidine kinase
MYYATPRGPQGDEQELVSRATYLAAIAIEQARTDERLQETTRVLSQHQDELQALTGKLFTAQEEERRRIARELHDDFNQRLAMLAIEVGGVKRELPSSPLRDRVAAVHQQIKTLADDVHTLAYQLHPSLLDDVGLEAALRDLLETFSRHTTIPTRLTTRHVPAALPRPQAGGVYRIVQESLQNVAKYARASEVVVRVRGMRIGLALIIRDNGVGFDAGLMGTPHGLGLQSMRERARLLGGVVRIRSRVGTGTRIGAWIP